MKAIIECLLLVLCPLYIVSVPTTITTSASANNNVSFRSSTTTEAGSTLLNTSSPSTTTSEVPTTITTSASANNNVSFRSSTTTEAGSTATLLNTSSPSTTTSEECIQYNSSCDSCVQAKGGDCLYCFVENTCMPYPVGSLLPTSSHCPLSEARWSVCKVSFFALIVAGSVILSVIVLTIIGICVYCCRRKKVSRGDLRNFIKAIKIRMSVDFD